MAAEKRARKGNAAIVDELGRIEKELAAEYSRLAPQQARAAELNAQVLGWYEKADASKDFIAEGVEFAYKVSARSLKTTVNTKKVWLTLGPAGFANVATIQLGLLKKAAGSKYKLCVSSARTGPRSLTAVEK